MAVRAPDSSASAIWTWSVTPVSAVKVRGRSRVSSRTRPQPLSRPAARASSRKAVPGRSTASRRTWSASHGCVGREILPVKTASSESAGIVAAASSGWVTGSSPMPVASPVPAGPSIQKRRRWNGYVGSPSPSVGAAVAAAPSRKVSQEMPAPRVHRVAAARVRAVLSSWSRRSVPETTTSAWPAAAARSSMAGAITGCGLISTNVSMPRPRRAVTVSAKRTGSRRFRYQYRASARSPARGCTVTDEYICTEPARGAMGPATWRSRSRMLSTCGVWDA